jgi:YHS domain-containing protein
MVKKHRGKKCLNGFSEKHKNAGSNTFAILKQNTMLKQILSAAVISAALLSCGAGNEKAATPEPAHATEGAMPHQHDSIAAVKPDLSAVKLDFQKDFVCGMPIKAGVEDTLTYKGKVYGFCAKECKDEFVKDPESYLAKK